MRAVTQVRS
jgi:hypothetical protein